MEISHEDLKKLVSMIAEELSKKEKKPEIPPEITQKTGNSRAILTAVGLDRPGIVAGISGELASNNVNILEISQTIVSGYFTMIMLLDLSSMNSSFETLKNRLEAVGEKLGVKVLVQKEDLFKYMHRI